MESMQWLEAEGQLKVLEKRGISKGMARDSRLTLQVFPVLMVSSFTQTLTSLQGESGCFHLLSSSPPDVLFPPP